MNSSTEIETRRTFAIISHPDAGKTTVTEKLLLLGGAINTAGTVKARKSARHATSDWMEIEQQRGISVTSSVMRFHYANCVINLLDTPGHDCEDLTVTTNHAVLPVLFEKSYHNLNPCCPPTTELWPPPRLGGTM